MKSAFEKPKYTHKSTVKNYRFWLVLSCAAMVGLWWCIFSITGLVLGSVLNHTVFNATPEVYNLLFLVASVVSMFVASVLSSLFAVRVFNRLKIQKPWVSSIAFFLSLVFGLSLFNLIVDFTYFQPSAVYWFLLGSMVVAGLVFGFLVRPFKHIVSSRMFVVVVSSLSVLPIVMSLLWRVVMINII